MSDQPYGVEYFVDLVAKMRAAQKHFFEHRDSKSYRESLQFEKLVDAWIVSNRIDREKLARFTGQKAN